MPPDIQHSGCEFPLLSRLASMAAAAHLSVSENGQVIAVLEQQRSDIYEEALALTCALPRPKTNFFFTRAALSTRGAQKQIPSTVPK